MSKKRIKELEAELAKERAERIRLEQAQKQRQQREGVRRPNGGPVPVAPPADFIQLTPIVQPVAFVPYSTQQQPLAMFEDDYDYMY